jgi:hypothetical protein
LAASALLSSISIFWLFTSSITDRKLAALGVLFVLCLGAAAGGQGLIGLLTRADVTFFGLPFLRRYEPAPLFPSSSFYVR